MEAPSYDGIGCFLLIVAFACAILGVMVWELILWILEHLI